MAVAYVAKKGVAEASRKEKTAFPLPTGATAKQMFMVSVLVFGTEAATAFGTPVGCELKINKYDTSFGARRGIFWGEYNGSTVPEITYTGTLETGGYILTFPENAVWHLSEVKMVTTAAKEPALPEVTTTEANELLIAWQWEDSGASASAVPTGLTQRVQNEEEGVHALHIATGLKATAGATGALHFTFATAQGGVVAMIALKEAAAVASQPSLAMVV